MKIGMSKERKLNVGNYQSAGKTVWIENKDLDEKDFPQDPSEFAQFLEICFSELEGILDKEIELWVNKVRGIDPLS